MYWLDLNHNFTLNGITDIEDYQPVSHISFYEADAYCRYKNMRLPSEFEIELVLEKNKIKGLETDFVMGFTKNKNEYIPLSEG